jgi:predicted membrane-bound spermidine synthase
MSLGALLAGRYSERFKDPLRWYARIELAVGILGFAFHEIFIFVTNAAYDTLLPALGNGVAVLVVKWTISSLLILPQSVLLGATFPLMSAAVLRRFSVLPGRTLSILYFANSFGAAAGVLFAGFVLLAFAGLPGTLLVAAAINMMVALVALGIAQQYPARSSADSIPALAEQSEVAASDAAALPPVTLQRLLIGVAFGTAVASFIYEIGWIRMLSLVLGSATHSFELMLSAFILGLALGSFWVRKHADRWKAPTRALGLVQWLMGAAALSTLPLYTASFDWMATLMQTFARTDAGYQAFSFARYGIALAIMLPATFCAGITLPLITRILVVRGAGEGAIGRVYGFNTLGSIVGVVIAGLILMPLIGLKGMLVVGATMDMLLGVLVLAMIAGPQAFARRLAFSSLAVTAVITSLGAFTKDFDRRLLGSAVYRGGEIPRPGLLETLYHQDGRTATVSVQRRTDNGLVRISTNGKPDASLPEYWMEPCADNPRRPLASDEATQALAPLITLAHTPNARTAAVIGHGSGMSSHFALGSPTVEEVVTVEIEPAMVLGSRAFMPGNRRVFEDPRSTMVIDDAKSYFAASQRRFDFIFSEPSNPWVSGVASLFTTEFYRRLSGYLSDVGVFGQWLHLYEIDDALVLAILGAIHENFASYEVFQTAEMDILIVASNQPRLPRPDWGVFEHPAIVEDFCHNLPLSPRMLEAARLITRDALGPLLDQWGQPNSDFYPIVDLGAERTRFLNRHALGFVGLSNARFRLAAPFVGSRSAPTDETTVPVRGIDQMQALTVSAYLHQITLNGADASGSGDSLFGAVVYRMAQWESFVNGGKAPADWKAWLADLAGAERQVHGGVLGFASTNFYRSVWRYLDRADAPEFVRDVVSFREGLAAWDFQKVSEAGERLLQSILDRADYLPADEYLDGMVVAELRRGDPVSALHVFEAVAPLTGRGPTDLRLHLLDAYVNAALGEQGADSGRPSW